MHGEFLPWRRDHSKGFVAEEVFLLFLLTGRTEPAWFGRKKNLQQQTSVLK